MNLREAIKKLASRREDERTAAATVLLAAGREAVEPLCRALDNGGPKLRWEAARLLGRIADPAAAPRLENLLHDLEPGVERMAVWALGECGTAAEAPSLCRAVELEKAGSQEALDRLIARHPAARAASLAFLRESLNRNWSDLVVTRSMERRAHQKYQEREAGYALLQRLETGGAALGRLPIPADAPTSSLPTPSEPPAADTDALPTPHSAPG